MLASCGRSSLKVLACVTCACVIFTPVLASAQTVPWVTFEDPLSLSQCDVINTDNAELLLLLDTDELVLVTGRDVILADTFVDLDDNVLFEGLPFGFLSFEEDCDGCRTLWWVSLTGRVIHLDDVTALPSVTDLFPFEICTVSTVECGCDGCDFWDDPTPCDVIPIDTVPPIVDSVLIPQLVLNLCGAGTSSTLGMLFIGLTVLGFARGRRSR